MLFFLSPLQLKEQTSGGVIVTFQAQIFAQQELWVVNIIRMDPSPTLYCMGISPLARYFCLSNARLPVWRFLSHPHSAAPLAPCFRGTELNILSNWMTPSPTGLTRFP